jgi:hypothetical protein
MNRKPDAGFTPKTVRKVFRKRRTRSPWRECLLALLNAAIGLGLLVALLQLPARLDSLLLVSKVISAVLAGLGQIGLGLLQLLAGLAQLLGLLVVVALAVGALWLVGNGLFRLLRLLVPGVGNSLRLSPLMGRAMAKLTTIRPPTRPPQ